ncbi:hypothetical protein GG344DRAFT_83372 [Lentinula edodes]|nr:hypothetical protein GG344DRAFT_83372 [Lentinula edodes]
MNPPEHFQRPTGPLIARTTSATLNSPPFNQITPRQGPGTPYMRPSFHPREPLKGHHLVVPATTRSFPSSVAVLVAPFELQPAPSTLQHKPPHTKTYPKTYFDPGLTPAACGERDQQLVDKAKAEYGDRFSQLNPELTPKKILSSPQPNPLPLSPILSLPSVNHVAVIAVSVQPQFLLCRLFLRPWKKNNNLSTVLYTSDGQPVQVLTPRRGQPPVVALARGRSTTRIDSPILQAIARCTGKQPQHRATSESPRDPPPHFNLDAGDHDNRDPPVDCKTWVRIGLRVGFGLRSLRCSVLGAGWSSKGATETATEDGNDLVVAGIERCDP